MIKIPVGIALLFAAAFMLFIAANLLAYMMIGKVNRKLPENQQIGYIFLYPAKGFRITREYRRLYPDSHLNTLRIALNVIAFILGAVATSRLSHYWP